MLDEALDLRKLTGVEIQNLTLQDIPRVKRSSILNATLDIFVTVVREKNYVYDAVYMHRHICGNVHFNLGGSLIWLVMGPDYDCYPGEFFKLPWSRLVVTANIYSYGDIRSTFPRLDDKLYKKFFDVQGFEKFVRGKPVPEQLETLWELAEFLEGKGF